MNQFYNDLFRHLRAFGYTPFNEESELLLKKDQGDKQLLLAILPEILPGQEAIDYREIYFFMKQTAEKQMILTGKPVETMIVSMKHGKPSRKEILEIENLENLWFQDLDSGRILIYENQISDFYGLETELTVLVSKWINQERHQKRQIIRRSLTPVNLALILANILVFLVLSSLGNVADADFAASHGGAVYYYIVYFREYYRLFTSTFYHFGLDHLLSNMLILFLMGRILEGNIGSGCYAVIYFGSGFAAALTSLFITLAAENYAVSGGASGAVFGIMGGVMILVLYHIIIKGKRNFEGMSMREMIFLALLSIGYGFTSADVDNAAHIGGFLTGLLLTLIILLTKEAIKKIKR